MNIRKALQNPFVLVGQGFVVGAALFFATAHGEKAEASSTPAVIETALGQR